MTLEPVGPQTDVEELGRYATRLFSTYFVGIGIMEASQAEYMSEMFFSADSIRSNMASHSYRYFVIRNRGMRAGFCAVAAEDGRMFLSKLYLDAPFRGLGLGTKVVDALSEMCREEGLRAIWLTVNRFNTPTVEFYKARGFSVTETRDLDIGGGYQMNDYIMELTV